MELFIFARFHAKQGCEAAVVTVLRETVRLTREEQGCLGIQAFGSIKDPRLFYIHSRWMDEAAFDNHVELPHTLRFVSEVEPLIDHPLEVTRARPLG